ncbi:hypothetical protein M8J76_008001 [Diaphorina citri]|nr:hypothetical protein M8J76_008001 [Diaphorina citri]
MNRVQLLSDLVLFTKYKLLGEDILMNHIKYFQYETDIIVWSTFSALLKEIQAIFNDSNRLKSVEFLTKLSSKQTGDNESEILCDEFQNFNGDPPPPPPPRIKS